MLRVLPLLLALSALPAISFADKLLILGITEEPPNSVEGVPRPKPGMTKQKVTEVFGKPKAASDPVGSPPISRWVYDQFIVVFEEEFVINSVIKRPEFTDMNQ